MTNENNDRDFVMERIVLKDLSCETPMGQAVFEKDWRPTYDIRFNLRTGGLSEGVSEVILAVTVTALLDDEVVYLIEAQQAGVVTVADLAMEPEPLRKILAVQAPNLIFPYLREVVDSVATRGGFSIVGLQPPDFEAWYREANPLAHAGNG